MHICMYMYNLYIRDMANDLHPAENAAQAWRDHMQK